LLFIRYDKREPLGGGTEMKSPWRFFFVVEALLLLFAIWQILSNPPLLFLLIMGILSLVLVQRRQRKSNFTNFLMVSGLIAIFISLINSPALWLMLIFAILFIGLKGVELTGVDFTKHSFWRKKQMIIVETQEPKDSHPQKRKQQWIGNERIGSQVYEWDDINLDILTGDTIIDLGNTLLPKKENAVIVRKGFGRTRILVPSGVAIKLEHSTFIGNVLFEGEQTGLRNERITIYSADYNENNRRLKILTNTIVGDLEVIRV